ncbi:MAG: ribulose-phosphate 3-epimerase [Clostridia bacterium]|nr:ribulose-phosphate 3-epimerase [Clostridia bacterium]
MIKISPSVLSADFARLGEEVLDIKNAGADMVHLDVMDGAFVTNISFGMPVIQSLRKCSDMIFDVHLMIEKPERYVDRFIAAGADIVTFHLEATDRAEQILDLIKKSGKSAGISVKPKTPIEAVYPYLDKCDMVLVMTVEPGYGGQSLIPETLEKVRTLKAYIDANNIKLDIQVDGGITTENAREAILSGANILVAGSAIFGVQDRREAIHKMKKI